MIHFKKSRYFGGNSSPLIIHYPKRFADEAGNVIDGFAHITDIVPTSIPTA